MRTSGLGDPPPFPVHSPRSTLGRDFTLLWLGQTVSSIGDAVLATALVLWVTAFVARGQAWAPLAVSILLLATSLPVLFVRPLAGVLVDRGDRRRDMLAMDTMRTALVALLIFVIAGSEAAAGGGARHWQIGAVYAIVLLAGSCAQLFNPALFALLGDMVHESGRPRAIGLTEASSNLAAIVGPPLAAALVFGLGIRWALAIDSFSFAVSCLTLWALHPPARRPARPRAPAHRGTVLPELSEGIGFVATHAVLRTIGITLSVAMLGIGVLQALEVFFVTENLHAPAAYYGWLGAAFGIGSVAGSLVGSAVVRQIGLPRTFALAVIAVGSLLLAFARMTSFLPALIVFGLLGIPNAISNVALWPLVLGATPPALVGRVNSVLIPVFTLAALASTASAGYLDSIIPQGFHVVVLGVQCGPVDTLLSGSGLLVCAGGLYAVLRLRRGAPAEVTSYSVRSEGAPGP